MLYHSVCRNQTKTKENEKKGGNGTTEPSANHFFGIEKKKSKIKKKNKKNRVLFFRDLALFLKKKKKLNPFIWKGGSAQALPPPPPPPLSHFTLAKTRLCDEHGGFSIVTKFSFFLFHLTSFSIVRLFNFSETESQFLECRVGRS